MHLRLWNPERVHRGSCVGGTRCRAESHVPGISGILYSAFSLAGNSLISLLCTSLSGYFCPEGFVSRPSPTSQTAILSRGRRTMDERNASPPPDSPRSFAALRPRLMGGLIIPRSYRRRSANKILLGLPRLHPHPRSYHGGELRD